MAYNGRIYMKYNFKFTVIQELRKSKAWKIRATIPPELKRFFKGRHYFKSLGKQVVTRDDAISKMNGEEGNAFEQELLEKCNAIDPLIQKAEELLEALYCKYDEKTKRPLIKQQWYKNPDRVVHPKDLLHLKNRSTHLEEYNRVVNQLRGAYAEFQDGGNYRFSDLIEECSNEIIKNLDNPSEMDIAGIEYTVEKYQEQNFDMNGIKDEHYKWKQAGMIDTFLREEGEKLKHKVDGTYPLAEKEKDQAYIPRQQYPYQTTDKYLLSWKSLLKEAYFVSDDDIERYVRIKNAFNDFLHEEENKSLGKGSAGKTFKDAVDGYLLSPPAQNMRKKSLDTFKLAFDDFAKMYGWGIDLKHVDKNKAKDFINYLEKDYEQPNGKKGLANSTIKTKVSAIRCALTYAEQQTWDYTNTWINVSIAKRGVKQKARDRFRPDQLNKLFQLDMPEDLKLLLRILATTGFRLEEASALEKQDICYYENIYVYDLTRPNKILKTDQSARRVPIHRDVEEYIKPYIDNLKTDRLFPNFPKDKDGKVSKSASKKLMKYIKLVRMHDDQMLHVHSLRQTFRQKMNNTTGFTEAMIDYVGGWEFKGMGKPYNADEPFQMNTLKEHLDKIDVGYIHN